MAVSYEQPAIDLFIVHLFDTVIWDALAFFAGLLVIFSSSHPLCSNPACPLCSSTGNSGMGSYHGRHSFDQLSHLRSCLIKQLKMEGVNSMRYPPHTAKKLGWARFLLLRQVNVCKLRRMMMLATLVSLAAFVVQVNE